MHEVHVEALTITSVRSNRSNSLNVNVIKKKDWLVRHLCLSNMTFLILQLFAAVSVKPMPNNYTLHVKVYLCPR